MNQIIERLLSHHIWAGIGGIVAILAFLTSMFLNTQKQIIIEKKEQPITNSSIASPNYPKDKKSLKRLIFTFIDSYDEKMTPTVIDTFKDNRALLTEIVYPLIDNTGSMDKDDRKLWKSVINDHQNFKNDFLVKLIGILATERKKLKILEGEYVKWIEKLLEKKKEKTGVNIYYRPSLVAIDVLNKENTDVYACYDRIFSISYDPVLGDLFVAGINNNGEHYYSEDGWTPKQVAKKLCTKYMGGLNIVESNE